MEFRNKKIKPATSLKCEYADNPLGIDKVEPRFSWKIEPVFRGQEQTYYRLLVSSSRKKLENREADIWDSGRVQSKKSVNVKYRGEAELASGKRYYWGVKWWDTEENESSFSEIGEFEMGLLHADDWEGSWVGWPMGKSGGELLFRKEFSLDKTVRIARAYVGSPAFCEFFVNGEKIGDRLLDPGWTDPTERVLYSTYKIKGQINKGQNVVGVRLGNGRTSRREFIAQVEIRFEDGTRKTISTDWTWRVTEGPVVENSIYDGEIYDARKEKEDWDIPGYEGRSRITPEDWGKAQTLEGCKEKLEAQHQEPVKVIRESNPERMNNPETGLYVFDFGENIVGWAEIKLKADTGTRIRLKYAEDVYENGKVNQENLGNADATDTYIAKGKDTEVYQPRFTYHGFRYVQVEGLTEAPDPSDLSGKVVRSSVSRISDLETSNDLINSIQENVIRGTGGNLHSLPTDCPQRNERLGWLGDVTVYGEQSIYNFDMVRFYSKWLRDIADTQNEETGSVPDTAPFRWGSDPGDPGWGSCYVLLPWELYKYYGDQRILREHYDGIKKWVEFMRDRAEENILTYCHYGDWCPPEKHSLPEGSSPPEDSPGAYTNAGAFPANTPGNFTSTWFYYASTKTLAKIADVLGKKKDENIYSALAEKIHESFNKEFFDCETSNYCRGSQTCNTLPLYLEMVPAGHEPKVVQNLIKNIEKNDGHLATGIFGTKYLLLTLSKHGRTDIAYDIATNTDYPSWGYMIQKGATTIWERWEYETGPGMNSHNHPMLGSISAWFHRKLAGIESVESEPGFKGINIKPVIVKDLEYVKDTIETVRGEITSSWQKVRPGKLTLRVSIPGNSTGYIGIPKMGYENIQIKEKKKLLWHDSKYEKGIKGIKNASEKEDRVYVTVGSGSYAFEISGNN